MLTKKILPALLGLDLVVAGLSFVVLVALTFSGVFCRYALNRPILWQEEVQVWLFMWIVFFGGSAAFRYRGHIAIDMLVELFPRWLQLAVGAVINLLTLTVLGFLGYHGYRLVDLYLATNKATSVLQIPNALIAASIPVGCALMILNRALVIVRDWSGAAPDGAGEGEAA